MKSIISTIVATIPLIFFSSLQGVSIVYNLRVSQITRTRDTEIKRTGPSTFGVVLFDQARTWTIPHRHDGSVGTLASYTFTKYNFYCRADTAFAHVHLKSKHRNFSRTQMDDFLLTCGYSKAVGIKTKATFSLLLGFPTHKDTIYEGIQFGTGHNSFGLQLDGAHRFSAKENQSLLAAARYIRFFPASIDLPINSKCQTFDLDPGNLVDLFVGYNYQFKTNVIECGYNPSFLFSATITPEVAAISALNYIRSNFFAAYKHFFIESKHPQGFIGAISYGFDNKPKIFKNIISLWVAWGIMF